MSYILEALKKVEQKREQEDASRLPTFSSEQAPERKKPLIWPYILAAALFVNTGLALRLFGPWWTHEQEPSSISLSSPEPPYAAPGRTEKETQGRVSPARIAMNEPARSREAKISRTPGARQKEKSAAEEPTLGQKEPSETASLPAAQKAQAPERPEAPKEVQVRVAKAPSAAFAGKVVSPGELPPSIRSSLPEFKISGHAYAPDPQTRVVRINEKILQEGQELSPGLRVEEIVPDGIILSYSGYHFRIGVKDSRESSLFRSGRPPGPIAICGAPFTVRRSDVGTLLRRFTLGGVCGDTPLAASFRRGVWGHSSRRFTLGGVCGDTPLAALPSEGCPHYYPRAARFRLHPHLDYYWGSAPPPAA